MQRKEYRMRLVKRLKAKIKKVSSGCWEWQGSLVKGYGQISVRNKVYCVHRVVWKLLIGPLTPGLTLDHLCRNRACCNPKHLEEVTMKENILRGESIQAKNARKTHCKHGHKFNKANTYLYSRGYRQCRICTRQRHAAYYQRD